MEGGLKEAEAATDWSSEGEIAADGIEFVLRYSKDETRVTSWWWVSVKDPPVNIRVQLVIATVS